MPSDHLLRSLIFIHHETYKIFYSEEQKRKISDLRGDFFSFKEKGGLRPQLITKISNDVVVITSFSEYCVFLIFVNIRLKKVVLRFNLTILDIIEAFCAQVDKGGELSVPKGLLLNPYQDGIKLGNIFFDDVHLSIVVQFKTDYQAAIVNGKTTLKVSIRAQTNNKKFEIIELEQNDLEDLEPYNEKYFSAVFGSDFQKKSTGKIYCLLDRRTLEKRDLVQGKEDLQILKSDLQRLEEESRPKILHISNACEDTLESLVFSKKGAMIIGKRDENSE